MSSRLLSGRAARLLRNVGTGEVPTWVDVATGERQMDIDEAAFIAAICAEPADDNVRLVYADWLQERGREARAEFIRVQIELATPLSVTAEELFAETRPGEARAKVLAREGPRLDALTRRQLELIDANAHVWLFDLPPEFRPILPGAIRALYRRGFVERVGCTAADWHRHGDALRRSHPLCRVRLTTRPAIEEKTAVDHIAQHLTGYPWCVGYRHRTQWDWESLGRPRFDPRNELELAKAILEAEFAGIEFSFREPVAYEVSDRSVRAPESAVREFAVTDVVLIDHFAAARAVNIALGSAHPADATLRVVAFECTPLPGGDWCVRVNYVRAGT